MKRFLKVLFRRDNLLATLFVFAFMFVAGKIAINREVFDPFSKAFGDFQYTDLYFSELKEKKDIVSDKIVLVNVGHLGRDMIAEQILELNNYEPAVIGLPLIFKGRRSEEADSLLRFAIQNTPNLVMAHNLIYDEEADEFSGLEESDAYFHPVQAGFDNLASGDHKTVRSFNPQLTIDGTSYNSFSVEVMKMYDPTAVDDLLRRGSEEEIINFEGAGESFIVLDEYDLFDPSVDKGFLKDRIVLLGYLGSPLFNTFDIEDKHFTPLNAELAGRSIPDMYGVAVHANILLTMLNRSYISSLPEWVTYLIAFIICYLHIALMIQIILKLENWFDSLAKAIQLTSSILIFYIIFLLFAHKQLEVDSGLILVAVLLSSDLLELYGSIVGALNRKFGFKSLLAE